MRNNTQTRLVVLMFSLPSFRQFDFIQTEFETKNPRTTTITTIIHKRATMKQHASTMHNTTQTSSVVIMFLLPLIRWFNIIQNRIRNKESQNNDDNKDNNASTRNNQTTRKYSAQQYNVSLL